MIDIEKLLEQIIDINRVHENSEQIALAENLLEKYHSFRIKVSVIGHFSTGKSYLLNALLDFNEKRPLLPCDVTRETAFPAEITYTPGESYVQYFIDDGQNPAGIMDIKDFRDKNFRDRRDGHSVNPSRVRIFLHSQKLADIPKVSLIDMPGFESGIEAHNEALDRNLPDSSAYILAFSVPPTLTETMESILKELSQSRKTFPIMVALTHCDERPLEDSVDCAKRLEESLQQIFPPERFSFDVVLTGKGLKDVYRPIEDFLLDLQSRETNSGEFLYAKLEAPTLALADRTLAYLNGQLKALELHEQGNQETEDRVKKQIDSINATLEQGKIDLQGRIPLCAENVVGDVDRMLRDNLSLYTNKIYSSKGREDEIAAFQQRMNADIRQTIKESFTKNMEDSVQEYYQSVDKGISSLRYAFFDSEDLGKKFSSKVEGVGAATAMAIGGDLVLSSIGGAAITGIGTAIATYMSAALVPFVGLILASGGLVKLIAGLIRSKKEKKMEIQIKLEKDIYPEILEQLKTKLLEKMDEVIEHITQSAQIEAERQIKALKKAVEDAKVLQKADKDEQDKKKQIIQNEIREIQGAMQ